MMGKNNITKTALNIILAKKQMAEDIAEKNFAKALENAEFKNSFLSVQNLKFEKAKLEFENNETNIINAKIECEQKKALSILKQLKIKASSLKPQYYCKKCKDKGFNQGQSCSCLKNEISNLILKLNNINANNLPSFETSDFNIFNESLKSKIIAYYDKTKEFINKFKSTDYKNIILVGKTGVGKTHLLECALNYAIALGYISIFTTAYNLSDVFLKYHLAELNEKEEILQPYLTCELLIIDDLGSERILDKVTREYLYIILCERSRNNLKTFISTNLEPDQIISVYDERIYSRIFNKRESITLNFEGDDLRLKK